MLVMTWFRKIIKYTILEIRHKKSCERSSQITKQLHESEKLDAESLHATQEERLSQLLLHAYQHVPYYHNVLNECGVIGADEKVNISRFHMLPLLGKPTINQNWDELKSDDLNLRQIKYNSSGGSTGELVRLIQDCDYTDWSTAATMIYDDWSGLSVDDRKIILWGSKRDLLVGKESSKTRFWRWLNNDRWLNAYRMTEHQMGDYVEQINSFKPVQLLAYADSIDELAKFIECRGLKVYSPKAIMCSAGTLYPEMRERIERVFTAPVFNRYGSREVGAIACECEQHEGLHVSALMNYIEILLPDGAHAEPGEVGEVVVTSLVNYAMPLIRYRIGDLAAWAQKPCSCGRGWPLLKEVTGRVSDMFVTREGARVNGKYFHHLFYSSDWVRRFQIIQEDIDYVRVLIVPTDEDTQQTDHADELEILRKQIKLILGSGCRVEFEFMEDIPPTASGKYMYTISKVPTT